MNESIQFITFRCSTFSISFASLLAVPCCSLLCLAVQMAGPAAATPAWQLEGQSPSLSRQVGHEPYSGLERGILSEETYQAKMYS